MTETTKKNKVPINIIWDKILMLSIKGMIDSAMAQEIMESMLNKTIETRSKVIILDIIGVPIVDSAVANHLIKISKSTKLVGADTIISGISAEIAQTLVNLGIDLGNVVTSPTLSDALELAFHKIGYAVQKIT